MFAIVTSALSAIQLAAISQYFTIINATGKIDGFPELLYWHELSCSPVIAVSHTGLFNKPAERLCNYEPFGGVSRLGEVVYFDPALMVLNPADVPAQPTEAGSFSRYINQEIIEWKPIPSDLSVADVENDYLDFWLLYGSPTYLHFTEETFERAIKGDTNSTGSQLLFAIIKRVVAAAVKDHPDIFEKHS
jgi:hypothetical protein